MINPKNMRIIEIDVTNRCPHQCSNCTRFCGHHKNPFVMEVEVFKKAVDSLDDFQGSVGMIGGEPTVHPHFEELAKYLHAKRDPQNKYAFSRYPIFDMQTHIYEHLFHGFDKQIRRGILCSSLNSGYYKHFEVINDSFGGQLLNDHDNACQHQALLMSRKELGIPDDEWIQMRDACWLQNTWSASITPKGAFFCEVAGNLDMLFNGPGGWKVEPGWWDREPKDFGEQLQWCELCGACLNVPSRLSKDGRDDVTPLILEKLKAVGSPKALKGDVVIHEPEELRRAEYHGFKSDNEYMELGGNVRSSINNRNLYPKSFHIVLNDNLPQMLMKEKPKDWVIVVNNEKEAFAVKNILQNVIINPGCLYKLNNAIIFNVMGQSIREALEAKNSINPNIASYYPEDKVIDLDNDRSDQNDSFLEKLFSIKNKHHLIFGKIKVLTIFNKKFIVSKNKNDLTNKANKEAF